MGVAARRGLPRSAAQARRLETAAATARRLADAGAIVWVGYNTGADRAAALVASLEGSGGASGSEEQGEEGPGEEEVAGYSAAYARLHNAYK